MEHVKGKFSVILPYYNGKKYIEEAVDSILAQTYKDFELILIDDGSPSKIDSDFLISLVESKKDGRIKYHRKDNGGLSDARNFGIDHSDGEYIAFIDQDDLWDKDKLRLQAEVFARDEGVKFICTDAKTFGEKTGELRIGETWGFTKDGIVENSFSKMIKGCFVGCSSVAFKRSLIPEVGYSNKAYVVVTDYEYFFRFAEKTDFYFIAQSLLLYRYHEGNTSKQRVRGECEVISFLFNKKPRCFYDKMNLALHFFKSILLISRLCFMRIVKL